MVLSSVLRRDGGTIPALAELDSVLGMPTTVFGWGLGDSIHAPNERLLASMYDKGRQAWARLLLQLGEAREAEALLEATRQRGQHGEQQQQQQHGSDAVGRPAGEGGAEAAHQQDAGTGDDKGHDEL